MKLVRLLCLAAPGVTKLVLTASQIRLNLVRVNVMIWEGGYKFYVEADGATSHEGAAESRRRRRRQRVQLAAGRVSHIVSIYRSHVTKFSLHPRETLLTSAEHVAVVIL